MLYLDRHKRMLMNTGMTVYHMLRFYGKFNYSSLRLMKRVYRGYRKRTEDDFINPTPNRLSKGPCLGVTALLFQAHWINII